jgi:hypothetical protein
VPSQTRPACGYDAAGKIPQPAPAATGGVTRLCSCQPQYPAKRRNWQAGPCSLERAQNRVLSRATSSRPCQYSKWATCPGLAEPTGGGLGLGRVLQSGALFDDSLFPVTRFATSVGNRHHPKVIGSVDIEQGEWELCQPKLVIRAGRVKAELISCGKYNILVAHEDGYRSTIAARLWECAQLG